MTEQEYRDYLNVVKAIYPDSLANEIDNGNKDALDYVLNYQVMSKWVRGKVKDSSDVNKRADQELAQFEETVKTSLGADKTLDKYYAEYQVTHDQLRTFFIDQVKMEDYFGREITEDAKLQTYNQIKESGGLTQADYRHILIGTENRSKEEAKRKADELVKKLRSGADFATLARENTDDTGSKESGGLYTTDQLPLNQVAPEFGKAVMSLQLNQISDPVETQFGYHIIRVEKRSEMSFESIKKDITLYLVGEKQQEFLENNLKTILKEKNIPPSMIKEQPSADKQPESETQPQDLTKPAE